MEIWQECFQEALRSRAVRLYFMSCGRAVNKHCGSSLIVELLAEAVVHNPGCVDVRLIATFDPLNERLDSLHGVQSSSSESNDNSNVGLFRPVCGKIKPVPF